MTSSLIPTLAGPFYTDPSIFAREQEAIFERMWFCAARGSDVGTPGAFRTVQVGRESVLITRAADGRARAFLNVCRHRGRPVVRRGVGVGQAHLQMHVPRLGLRAGRQAGRRATTWSRCRTSTGSSTA